MSSLADRSITAAKWNLGGNFGRAAFQFVVGIVLARLLGPEAFGLVAIGWLVVNMGMLVADAGFAAAIVQRPQVSDDEVDFVFTVQLAFGLLLTGAAIAASAPLAAFFREPDAEAVIQAMSVLFVIRALGQTSTALLSRDLRHKVVQIGTLLSYLVGFVGVAIPMALAGSGVWGLVFGSLAQAAINTLIVITASRRLPRFGLKFSRDIFGFGGKVLAANIGSWIILNVDSVLVGRNLATESLGIYNRALMLVAQPAAAAVTAFQGVLFASCSRAESDAHRITRAYRAFTAAISLLCFPAFLTVAAIPETVIMAIYGPKWRAAIAILPALALAMIVHALLALVGPVLMAINKTKLEVMAQYGTVAIAVPVMVVATGYSLEAAAWAIVFIYLVRLALLYATLFAAISISLRDITGPIFLPAVIGACCAAATRQADLMLHSLSPFPRLIIDMIVAGITMLLLIRLLCRPLRNSALGILMGEGRLPRALQRWMGS